MLTHIHRITYKPDEMLYDLKLTTNTTSLHRSETHC